MSIEDVARSSELAYAECGKVARAFWDWRHRLMMFFFAGLVALAALEGWILGKHLSGRFVTGPLILGSLLGAVSAVLDDRVGKILVAAYKAGTAIEKDWKVRAGIYTSIDTMPGLRMSTVMKYTYWGLAAAMLVAAVVDLFEPVSP
jgi:hypothetical protein